MKEWIINISENDKYPKKTTIQGVACQNFYFGQNLRIFLVVNSERRSEKYDIAKML